MRKTVKSSELIIQRPIGFHSRQLKFFEEYPDFNPDRFCRDTVEEQISIIDPNFLEQFDE